MSSSVTGLSRPGLPLALQALHPPCPVPLLTLNPLLPTHLSLPCAPAPPPLPCAPLTASSPPAALRTPASYPSPFQLPCAPLPCCTAHCASGHRPGGVLCRVLLHLLRHTFPFWKWGKGMVLRLFLICSVSVWTWGQRGQVQMAQVGEQWAPEGGDGQPAPQSRVCPVREQREAGGSCGGAPRPGVSAASASGCGEDPRTAGSPGKFTASRKSQGTLSAFYLFIYLMKLFPLQQLTVGSHAALRTPRRWCTSAQPPPAGTR